MQQTDYEEISALLHDAQCLGISWDRSAGRLRIVLDCLRRNVDGSTIEDRSVTFTLHDVAAIGVGYDSLSMQERPSEFIPAEGITIKQLEEWPYHAGDTGLTINSDFDEQLVLESARLDWLHNDNDSFAASAVRFCLCFNHWSGFGLPCIQLSFLFGASRIEIQSIDGPLALAEWREQYTAWWKGWKRHWSGGIWHCAGVFWHWLRGGSSRREGCIEDTLIPAGEPSRSQRRYSPPKRPVFQIGATDAPAELLDPVQAWFEGAYTEDWSRMARAWPADSKSESERASSLKEQAVHEFGFWGFPRHVQQWWMEGSRACVVLRGVEHVMPMDGEPAEDNRTVWACDLRLRGGRWIIQGMSKWWDDSNT